MTLPYEEVIVEVRHRLLRLDEIDAALRSEFDIPNGPITADTIRTMQRRDRA